MRFPRRRKIIPIFQKNAPTLILGVDKPLESVDQVVRRMAILTKQIADLLARRDPKRESSAMCISPYRSPERDEFPTDMVEAEYAKVGARL